MTPSAPPAKPGRDEPGAARPDMPVSYGLRDPASGGLIPWGQAEERLGAAHNYWVATTRPDGRPHAMPVWGVWLDGAFYFSTDRGSRKARNLAVNPGLVIHLESGDDVVTLEGLADEVTDPTRLESIAEAYFVKYQVRLADVSGDVTVYGLAPRAAFAWQERDFPGTATRWRFGRTRQ